MEDSFFLLFACYFNFYSYFCSVNKVGRVMTALRRITTSHRRAAKAKAANEVTDWEDLPELPKEFKQIRGMGHFTQEDIDKDERLAYIVNK